MARDDLYRELHRVLASTYDLVGSLKEPHPKYKWAVKFTRADHAKFQAKELRIFELIRELRLLEFVPYDEHSQDSPYPTLGLGSEEHIHPDVTSSWMREMSQLRDVVANYVAELPGASQPVGDIEWSHLTYKKYLRAAMRIGKGTLDGMLIEQTEPETGKIRFKRPHAKARIIQVAITDLPPDVQSKFQA